MKKLFKTNQNEYLKTDRQGNICLRTTDANKLNKNKFISTFQNKLYRFCKNLCTRSTHKVHIFFKASSCETKFVSANKLYKNSLVKIILGKNQKNKLIFWYWYETLPCPWFVLGCLIVVFSSSRSTRIYPEKFNNTLKDKAGHRRTFLGISRSNSAIN